MDGAPEFSELVCLHQRGPRSLRRGGRGTWGTRIGEGELRLTVVRPVGFLACQVGKPVGDSLGCAGSGLSAGGGGHGCQQLWICEQPSQLVEQLVLDAGVIFRACVPSASAIPGPQQRGTGGTQIQVGIAMPRPP